RGLVIVYHNEREPIEAVEEGDTIRVSAPAQVGLSRLGRHCCERGWAGLDWAVGLPGTVGGAVANNAGAHGTEMIDNLETVTVVAPDGALATHEAGWLQARYRHTILRSPDPAERPRGAERRARGARHSAGDGGGVHRRLVERGARNAERGTRMNIECGVPNAGQHGASSRRIGEARFVPRSAFRAPR